MDTTDTIVGYTYKDKAYYCVAHRPSAPDDVPPDCRPAYASDVTDQECEACGAALIPSPAPPR